MKFVNFVRHLMQEFIYMWILGGKRFITFTDFFKVFMIKTCLRTMASEITAKNLGDPSLVIYRWDLPFFALGGLFACGA